MEGNLLDKKLRSDYSHEWKTMRERECFLKNAEPWVYYGLLTYLFLNQN